MKIFYRTLVGVVAAMAFQGAFADIPKGYYSTLEGKSDAELKTAVSECCVYVPNGEITAIYSALPKSFLQTDVMPGTYYWWDMYSEILTPNYLSFGTSESKGGGGMNREHAFPKSWWGGIDTTPAWCDLNHLYPSKDAPNKAKSNWPLGTVKTTTYANGVTKVGYPVNGQGGGARLVFEPADEYKGDFARAYFYMVTRYQNLKWNTSYTWMMDQNTYPTLKQWAIDMLMQWAHEDPVSQKEIDRNEAVYAIQRNRNPFIDHPELADYIWGEKKGQKFTINNTPAGDPVLESPVAQSALDFPELALGQSYKRQLRFLGENLTGTLYLTLTGTNRKMFKLSVDEINTRLINKNTSPDGFIVTVTYTPTAVGDHSARISITDGGLSASRSVNLLGTCSPVPDLKPVDALAATDITEDTYVANWTASPVQVDYYIIRRTIYANGSSTVQELPTSDTSMLIEDFSMSDSESYNVRTFRLGYESSRSNEIYVEHAGVEGVEADMPMGWAAVDGGITVYTPATIDYVSVYDLAGRLIKVVENVENGQTINLGAGAYIVVANGRIAPLKVIVR